MIADTATDVRERLKVFVGAGHPVGLVARATRRAQQTISDYLLGRFDGNSERLERTLDGFLKRQELRPTPTFKPVFAWTSVAEDISSALLQAQIEGDMLLIFGASGVGKSEAAKAYCQREHNAVLLTANASWTSKALVMELAKALELDRIGKSLSDTVTEISNALENSGRIIIVDEADYICARGLEIMRQIHDQSRAAIAFVGMAQFYATLKRGDSRHSFTQIYNRLGNIVQVNEVTRDDLLAIIPDAKPSVIKFLHDHTSGCARAAVKLYQRALRYAGASGQNGGLTLGLLKQTTGQ